MYVKGFKVFRGAVVFFALVASGVASAVCESSGPGRNVTLDFPAFDPIDQDAEIGSVLATVTASTSQTVHVVCGPAPRLAEWFDTPLAPAGVEIFASDIPGVGIKLYTPHAYIPFQYGGGVGGVTYDIHLNPVTVELVKIGEITRGGTLFSSRAFFTREEKVYSTILQTVSVSSIPVVTLAKPTCAAVSPVVNVDFGQVNFGDLDAAGRSPDVPFNIDLTCSGGGAGETTDVYVTLTDQNNPSNISTQLELVSGGATGVVIEVKNKNGLVSFGPDSTDPGNPGRWLEGAAAAGNFSIPLSANYLQVGTNPTPGPANALATYTLSYQ